MDEYIGPAVGGVFSVVIIVIVGYFGIIIWKFLTNLDFIKEKYKKFTEPEPPPPPKTFFEKIKTFFIYTLITLALITIIEPEMIIDLLRMYLE